MKFLSYILCSIEQASCPLSMLVWYVAKFNSVVRPWSKTLLKLLDFCQETLPVHPIKEALERDRLLAHITDF